MTFALRACRMLAVSLLATLPASGADASAIASRTALQTLLGGGGTIEDFEAFSFPSLSSYILTCTTLTSASVCNGQGPGLVQPGLTFSAPDELQWNDAGYVGAASREILANSTIFVIDFATAPAAVGVDLRAYTGYGDTAQMDVYGADDSTLLGSITGIVLSTSGIPVFAGWQDAGGIGKFVLTPTIQEWSPIIDNLEYGAIAEVPEPASAALLGLGLAVLALRRPKRRAG